MSAFSPSSPFHILPLLLILLLPSPASPSGLIACSVFCTQKCKILSTGICTLCLESRFQRYNIVTLSCECMPSYFAPINAQGFCCHYNCMSCGEYGCTSCRKHATLKYDKINIYYYCQCDENYGNNETVRACRCRAGEEPERYYYDEEEDVCYRCPEGCWCDERGCVECGVTANREVRRDKYQRLVCPCIGDLLDLKGLCRCPENCTCDHTGRLLTCSRQSNRIYHHGSWICSSFYQFKQGTCHCDLESQNLVQILNPYSIEICACKSQMNSTASKRYSNSQERCGLCTNECKCDDTGCYSCDADFAVSINNECFCIGNFTQSAKWCECQVPYYTYFEDPDEDWRHWRCYCLSEKYPAEYYYVKETGECLKCPEGCWCDERGCVECAGEEGGLREVVRNGNGEYSCRCVRNAFETEEQVCKCEAVYVYDKGRGGCVCDVGRRDSTFQDVDRGTCEKCPKGCVCDKLGCHRCDRELLKEERVNSEGRLTCYCRDGVVTTPEGYCICPPPLQWNHTTQKCQCQPPNYLNLQFTCICSSFLYPDKFYFDPLTSTCYQCPHNCICNSSGCIECSADSLRFILKTNSPSKLSICRCRTYAFFVNNHCLKCPISSYYYSEDCIPCVQCETCDSRGCLSCKAGMVLENFTCVCEDDFLRNIAGYCACEEGFYLKSYDKSCQPCPVSCDQCKQEQNKQSTYYEVTCLSCPVDSNRLRNPKDNCRCSTGYAEVYPPQQICCPIDCASCNSTSCHSCHIFSHKIILEGECVCPPLMMESNGTCYCSEGYYLLNSACRKCPAGCLECYYWFMELRVVCTKCFREGRRELWEGDCACMYGYEESSYTKKQYCIPQNCLYDEMNCTRCMSPFIVSPDHLCVCPDEMFAIESGTTCAYCSDKWPGCSSCVNGIGCIKCRQNTSHLLAFPRCVLQNAENSIQFYQTPNVTMLFSIPRDQARRFVKVNSILIRPLEFWTVYEIEGKFQQSFYFVEYEGVFVEGGIVVLKMRLPISFNQSLMSVGVLFKVVQGEGEGEREVVVEEIYHVKVFLIKRDSPLSPIETHAVNGLALASLTLSYTLFVSGYKHNQLIFLLQTLSFASFKINNTLLTNIFLAHDLKYIYFSFGTSLFSRLFEPYYVEPSKGNYHFLTIDSNILRVADVSVVVGFVTLCVLGVVFVGLCWSRGLRVRVKRMRYSKWGLRTLEFLYKTTMYPLVFFSMENVVFNRRYSPVQGDWDRVSFRLSLAILTIYTLTTILESLSYLNSKLYKRISLIEFSSCILCSLSLILCGEENWIILVVIVVTVKNVGYYYLRAVYLGDSSVYNLVKYVPFGMEIGVLVGVGLVEVRGVVGVGLLGGLVGVEAVVAGWIVRGWDMEGVYDKENGGMVGGDAGEGRGKEKEKEGWKKREKDMDVRIVGSLETEKELVQPRD